MLAIMTNVSNLDTLKSPSRNHKNAKRHSCYLLFFRFLRSAINRNIRSRIRRCLMSLAWPDLTLPPINLYSLPMPTTSANLKPHTQSPVSRIKQIQDEAYAKGYNQALADIKAKIQEKLDKNRDLKKPIDKL